MADNVAVTPGTGATIAADEVVDATLGTVKVQYVKLMYGDLDSTTKVGSSSPLPAKQSPSTSAAVTSVSASATSVSLLASNSSRLSAMFFNDSTATLYLKFGTTASTTSHTVQIAAGGYFELSWPGYTGAIDGVWSAANGAVRITELS